MSIDGTMLTKPKLGQTWAFYGVDRDLYPDGVAFLITDVDYQKDDGKDRLDDDYRVTGSFLQWLKTGDTKYPLLTIRIQASKLILCNDYRYWVTNPEHWAKIRSH